MGAKALLFLPEETLEDLRQALVEYAPLIETFSQVDSLNSLFELVNRQLRNVPETASAQQQPLAHTLPVLHRIMEEASKSITGAAVPPTPGITPFFGDRPGLYLTFASGQIYAVLASAASEDVEVQAIHRLRELVRETQLEVPGVNAGITGEPVLKHDEMVQAERDVTAAALLSLILVAVIFIYGYHEIRRPILATVCLLIGIGYTLGFATLTVGRLNILSITLVPDSDWSGDRFWGPPDFPLRGRVARGQESAHRDSQSIGFFRHRHFYERLYHSRRFFSHAPDPFQRRARDGSDLGNRTLGVSSFP
jgi:hypothetical protein